MGANNGFFFGLVPGLIKKKADEQKDKIAFEAASAAAEQTKKVDAQIAAQEKQTAAAIQTVKDSQAAAPSKAVENVRRKTSAFSQTIYTSPLGLSGQAATAKKILLGQ